MKADVNAAAKKEPQEAVEIEDEDDYAGYFLVPTANPIDMVERVAEANRKLYEDGSDKEDSERPKKVQFSERLINFEPETYESDELDDSEDDGEKFKESKGRITERWDRPKTARKETKEMQEREEIGEEIEREPTIQEEVEDDSQDMKVLLVMLPREQSSSCESVIGEEISGETKPEAECTTKKEGTEEVVEISAVGELSKANCVRTVNSCKISKISLDLKCSPKVDSKKRDVRLGMKCKEAKEAEKEEGRSKSCVERKKRSVEGDSGDRPKTSVDRRNCCVVRTGLPRYNGLRSEYGLSAEQLQDRRRKTSEMKQQRRAERTRRRQEETRRRLENEENFCQWLCSKRRGARPKRPARVDTLSRSDVYIQTHAVYARRRGVSYSVEYALGARKKSSKTPGMIFLGGKPEKCVNLERLFDNVSPHVKHTYRIHLGGIDK